MRLVALAVIALLSGCADTPTETEPTDTTRPGAPAATWNYTLSFELAYHAGLGDAVAVPASECIGIRITMPEGADKLSVEFRDQASGPGGADVYLYDPLGREADYAVAGVPDQATAETPMAGRWSIEGRPRMAVQFSDMVDVQTSGLVLDGTERDDVAASVECIEP